MPYVVTAECILCGACVSGCESNAITEGETQSHIDVNLCIECGTCEANCPVQAIYYAEESKTANPQDAVPADLKMPEESKPTPDP
ncbi:MAG: 4Fe-4S binding protein [Chloroflexi bacterium]|nr:4Fe-4S binding protein [Chloroflexota bacterium]